MLRAPDVPYADPDLGNLAAIVQLDPELAPPPTQTKGKGKKSQAKGKASGQNGQDTAQAVSAPADILPPLPNSLAAADVAGDDMGNAADESIVEPEAEIVDNDYRLDCSICRRRGMNLDSNQRLVQCDYCDRWEHVKCHRQAAQKAGLPKPDYNNEPFVCEDCQVMKDESIIVTASAPKRERSEKQMEGARRGAEKRRAKAAAKRAKLEKEQRKLDGAKGATRPSPAFSTAPSVVPPPAAISSEVKGQSSMPPTSKPKGKGKKAVASGSSPIQAGSAPASSLGTASMASMPGQRPDLPTPALPPQQAVLPDAPSQVPQSGFPVLPQVLPVLPPPDQPGGQPLHPGPSSGAQFAPAVQTYQQFALPSFASSIPADLSVPSYSNGLAGSDTVQQLGSVAQIDPQLYADIDPALFQ